MDEDVLNAGFQAQFLDFLAQYEIPVDFTALEAVRALNQECLIFTLFANFTQKTRQKYHLHICGVTKYHESTDRLFVPCYNTLLLLLDIYFSWAVVHYKCSFLTEKI